MYRKTYVKIDVDRLQSNINNILDSYTGYKWYIGVVKGNAYGHGYRCVEYMEQAGINYFAVASLEEAIKVRQYTKLPILCLQPIDTQYMQECIDNDVTITVCSKEYVIELLDIAKSFAKTLKVHIKINSGMNRLGIEDKAQLKQVYNMLNSDIHINVEGIYTHFATAGVMDKYWDIQKAKFEEITSSIDIKKISIVHLGKSATIVNHEKISYANGVRLGIIMYGYTDSKRVRRHTLIGRLKDMRLDMKIKNMHLSQTIIDCKADVKQVLSLVSNVVQVRKVNKGSPIGYGAMYIASKDTNIAVAEIGYADGLLLNNTNGFCEINNTRYRIVGVICMGMILIEVDDKVKKGDEVVLIGGSISTKEVAMRTHTTTYFTTTNLSYTLPRLYIKGKEVISVEEN